MSLLYFKNKNMKTEDYVYMYTLIEKFLKLP